MVWSVPFSLGEFLVEGPLLGQHGTLRSTKSPPQGRHSTRTELANPGATHKWNILTSLNEDLMKTLKS